MCVSLLDGSARPTDWLVERVERASERAVGWLAAWADRRTRPSVGSPRAIVVLPPTTPRCWRQRLDHVHTGRGLCSAPTAHRRLSYFKSANIMYLCEKKRNTHAHTQSARGRYFSFVSGNLALHFAAFPVSISLSFSLWLAIRCRCAMSDANKTEQDVEALSSGASQFTYTALPCRGNRSPHTISYTKLSTKIPSGLLFINSKSNFFNCKNRRILL